MQRDYEVTKTKYQSLMGRKVEAEVAQELEAKNGKALFNVISPAFVPTSPARPDRPTAFFLAFVNSLGLGVLAASPLEQADGLRGEPRPSGEFLLRQAGRSPIAP